MPNNRKQKENYVDGFVLSIPKKNAAAYKKMAQEGKNIWLRFGALDYKECMIDDVKPPHVSFTFPKMAKSKPSENVWFSFITYKNKKHRDMVNKKVMAYFEKKYDKEDINMPFDIKRMSYGGFKVIVGS